MKNKFAVLNIVPFLLGIVGCETDTNLDLDTRDLIILGLYVSCFIDID